MLKRVANKKRFPLCPSGKLSYILYMFPIRVDNGIKAAWAERCNLVRGVLQLAGKRFYGFLFKKKAVHDIFLHCPAQ